MGTAFTEAENIQKKSSLNLPLLCDTESIAIRVAGRLSKKHLPENPKFPAIIPKESAADFLFLRFP